MTQQTFLQQLPQGPPIELVVIPAGSFLMGSNERDREQPIHKGDVPAFKLGKYPITNAQYAAFLNAYGAEKVQAGKYKGQQMVHLHRWGVQQENGKWKAAVGYENHPIINVTWYGVNEFCTWLSEETGLQYSLPSEAQWEYAARANQPKLKYAGSNKLEEVGWYDKNSHGETHPVGQKKANAWGLYDMSGNVDEWCADVWHDSYQGAPNDGRAWIGGGDQGSRVVRGGGWYYIDDFCRVSYRYGDLANGCGSNVGCRLSGY